MSEQRAALRTATAGSRAVSLAALGSVPRAGSGWVPVATAARVAAAAAAVGAMTSTMAVSASVLTMRSATVSTWSGGGAASGLTGPQPPRTKANFGVVMVPQQEAWVVERFQAYWQVLKPGLHLLVPFMHRVAYVHSLKQVAVAISDQRAITKDNVQLHVDGVLYYQINDPYAASCTSDPPACVRECCDRGAWVLLMLASVTAPPPPCVLYFCLFFPPRNHTPQITSRTPTMRCVSSPVRRAQSRLSGRDVDPCSPPLFPPISPPASPPAPPRVSLPHAVLFRPLLCAAVG